MALLGQWERGEAPFGGVDMALLLCGGLLPQPWGDRETWGKSSMVKPTLEKQQWDGETEAPSGCGSLGGFAGAISAR